MTTTGKTGKSRGNHRNLTTETGFTLIEVLVALTILTVGLLAIASMQISAIQTTGGAKSISEGVMWAEDRMEFLSSLPYTAAALGGGANKPDPLSPSPSGYAITYTVANNQPAARCKLITINVSWNDRGRTKTTTLTGVKPQL